MFIKMCFKKTYFSQYNWKKNQFFRKRKIAAASMKKREH